MPLPLPTSLWIEPCNVCNAACPLCPTGAGVLNRAPSFFNFELYCDIIDQVRPQRMNFWNFGEPFLHPDIFRMFDYARGRGVKDIWCSTNGFVFYDQENLSRLLTSGPDRLIVGLDGIDAATSNQYRVGVRFDQVLEGLRALMQKGPFSMRVAWQFIVMRHNAHQLEAARAIAQELGCDFWVKKTNLDMLPQQADARWLPDDDDFRRYEEDGQSVRVKGGGTGRCFFTQNTLILNADGSVVPCCFDAQNELVLGNCKTQTIAEIWHGEPLRQLRETLHRDRASLSPCNRCAVGLDVFVEGGKN